MQYQYTPEFLRRCHHVHLQHHQVVLTQQPKHSTSQPHPHTSSIDDREWTSLPPLSVTRILLQYPPSELLEGSISPSVVGITWHQTRLEERRPFLRHRDISRRLYEEGLWYIRGLHLVGRIQRLSRTLFGKVSTIAWD